MSQVAVVVAPIGMPQVMRHAAIATFVCREATEHRVLLEADNIIVEVQLAPGAAVPGLRVGGRYALHLTPAAT